MNAVLSRALMPYRIPFAVHDPAPRDAPGARSLRVLVIEDNNDSAESLRDALEVLGHDARVALDGASGLALAREAPPDVVLCDIGLPDMNGYAVATALRADPRLAACRLIALSGYTQPTDVARASAAGFQEYLAKPPDLERLRELLSREAAALLT